MTAEIEQVLEELKTEIVILAQVLLKEQGIGEESELYKSLETNIDLTNKNIITDTLFNNYIIYIENGRAPKTGKRPPIDALRDWVQSKGLPTDNNTLHAISTAIWRDGIAPRPILATLQERVTEYMDNKFNDRLIEVITNKLNTYFE